MNFFWKYAYDDEKDRRYGTLFFTALVLALGALLVVALLSLQATLNEVQDACIGALPVIFLTMVFVCLRWIYTEREYRRRRLEYYNLSRDELAKARLKLKRQIKPAAFKTRTRPSLRRAPRPMDTYLKY